MNWPTLLNSNDNCKKLPIMNVQPGFTDIKNIIVLKASVTNLINYFLFSRTAIAIYLFLFIHLIFNIVIHICIHIAIIINILILINNDISIIIITRIVY